MIQFRSDFKITVRRPDGSKSVYRAKNKLMPEGARYFLDSIMLLDGDRYTYFGFVDDDEPFTAYADSDTLASHSGWTEGFVLSTYRPEIEEPTFSVAADGTSAEAILTLATFTADLAINARGLFICTDSWLQSDTSGLLWSLADIEGGPLVIAVNDSVDLTYTTTVEG